ATMPSPRAAGTPAPRGMSERHAKCQLTGARRSGRRVMLQVRGAGLDEVVRVPLVVVDVEDLRDAGDFEPRANAEVLGHAEVERLHGVAEEGVDWYERAVAAEPVRARAAEQVEPSADATVGAGTVLENGRQQEVPRQGGDCFGGAPCWLERGPPAPCCVGVERVVVGVAVAGPAEARAVV